MKTDIRGGWTSASNALADSLCPGRHRAQQGIEDTRDDADRESGSRIHQALCSGDGTVLSLDERETFEACRSIETKLAHEFFGGNHTTEFREQRYWIEFGSKPLRHSGQVDVLYRTVGRSLILEYKTLFGDVPESPKNMQLRDQAVLVHINFMFSANIGAAVIQPWVTHSPEICLYEGPDILKAMERLEARVKASNDPASPRIPGEVQCKFCLAKSSCTEYQKWAAQIAPPAVLNLLDVPMSSWSPAQRAIAAAQLKPCADFLDDLKAFLKEGLAKDPGFVPGWMLAPGGKRELITDPQKCFERFVAIGGTLEQFMVCLTVKKGSLREAINKIGGASGMALDGAVKTLTEGLVEVKQNEPSLKKVKE